MQKLIYSCDSCKKEIGKKPHISLVLASHNNACGIAVPPGKDGGPWTVLALTHNFLHFCSPEHVATYFKTHLEKAIKSKA